MPLAHKFLIGVDNFFSPGAFLSETVKHLDAFVFSPQLSKYLDVMSSIDCSPFAVVANSTRSSAKLIAFRQKSPNLIPTSVESLANRRSMTRLNIMDIVGRLA